MRGKLVDAVGSPDNTLLDKFRHLGVAFLDHDLKDLLLLETT